ncbi:LppU/SCO3897 family protein [Actinomadura scrupuli]|uniref:LppU/SCO3897 family protein n=1 Tax=Actinomadura scrupuli TaxID=559629 RepID=UPI003D966594
MNDAENASLIKVVSCSDREATFQVIGKVDNVYSDDFDGSRSRACAAYPTTTRFFWKGRAGSGYVLCLAPKGPGKG